jgi:uncharacterized phage-associated protein
MSVTFRFQQNKALAAIELLAEKGMRDLTKGKIAKLLFFADKRHLVQYGRPITGDWYAALPHGPIPSNVDNLLDAFEAGNERHPGYDSMKAIFELDKQFNHPRIKKRTTAQAQSLRDHLSQSDVETLQECAEQLGRLTFSQLRSISHDQPAYKNAWEMRGTANQYPMRFEDFFEDDQDSLAGVKESMIEDFILYQNFPEPSFD